MIQKINAEDLRKMEGKEGLILQGCGGDPQEWLDGINDLLTKEGILQNGTKFENAYVFENEGITNGSSGFGARRRGGQSIESGFPEAVFALD